MKKIILISLSILISVLVIAGFYMFIFVNNDSYIPTEDSEPSSILLDEKDTNQKIEIVNYLKVDDEKKVTYSLSNGSTFSFDYVDDLLGDRLTNIDVVDINYDGNEDLHLSYITGAYNAGSKFKVFSESQGKLIDYDSSNFVGGFPSDSAIFNAEEKTLVTFYKSRGIGDLYSISKYSFQNGKWYLTEEFKQDILDYRQDARVEALSGYYIQITQYYENGLKKSEERKFVKLIEYPDNRVDYEEVSKDELIDAGIDFEYLGSD